MGRVYAVASGKGGVGKTTTTVNLGAAFAAAGHEVAVVDTDLGMANLAGGFGVEPSSATIHDVLAGEADVADATYEGAGGVSVVPGSDDVTAFARSDPESLDDVVDALSDYDFVLLDTGASLTHVTVRPLAIADEVLLVSTTERAALGDTDRTREVTRRVGGSVVGAALTRVDPSNPNAEAVTAALDAKVLEVVPEDSAVGEAMAAGEPLEVYAPRSQAAAAYRRLAALLSGDAERGPDVTESESESASPADGSAADESPGDADDDVSNAVASVVGESGAPEQTTEPAVRGEAEDEGEERTDTGRGADDPASDPSAEASAGSGDADTGETGGLSDTLAAAETGAGTDADAAEAHVPTLDASADDSDDAEETDADEGAVGETDGDSADEGETTVSETVLADESTDGLVKEAEPGESDPARTDESEGEGRNADAESEPSTDEFGSIPDAESSTDDGEDDDGEDGDSKGFFRRLLG